MRIILLQYVQYYGPMHDGPVWPLLLKPADAPLSPTWQIGSVSSHATSETVLVNALAKYCLGGSCELTRRITTSWEKNGILTGLEKNYSDENERILDIGVARALVYNFEADITSFIFIYCVKKCSV